MTNAPKPLRTVCALCAFPMGGELRPTDTYHWLAVKLPDYSDGRVPGPHTPIVEKHLCGRCVSAIRTTG